MTIRTAVLRLCVALVIAGPLSAQTIIVFDTLNVSPPRGGVANRIEDPALSHYQRFTVTGTGPAIEINQVTVRVGGATSWGATLELWSDNGGTPLTTGDTPGSFIQVFDNVTGIEGSADVTFTGSMLVNPGTSYWLYLRPDSGEAGLGYLGNTAAGSSGGSGPWLTSNDYWSYYGIFGSYALPGGGGVVWPMSIGVVPEPSTCAAMAGFAALGSVAWHRRRQGATD